MSSAGQDTNSGHAKQIPFESLYFLNGFGLNRLAQAVNGVVVATAAILQLPLRESVFNFTKLEHTETFLEYGTNETPKQKKNQ